MVDITTIRQAQNYIKTKPYLIWSTSNYENLSPQSIAEHIINYGDWDDFIYIRDLFGTKEVALFFKNIVNKKRVNLSPRTTNYFTNYFAKYA